MHRHGTRPLVRLAAIVALLAVGTVVVPAAATDRVVVVRQGDTLSEIALRHGVTVGQLMALNSLSDPNRIYPGQRLRLVAEPAASAQPPTAPSTPTGSNAIVHVVRAGEHLTGIAHRYRSTIAAIVEANHIKDPSYLRVGQRLTIPGAGPAPSASPNTTAAAAPVIHVVAAGETVTSISHRYGTTIAAIVQVNGLSDASHLRVGQRLTIPGTSTLVAPGPGMPTGMASLVTARARIGEIVAAEATAQGVPVAFALAVAWQESGWRADAVSWAGAVGVMQLTRPTADWVARSMLHEKVQLTDARSNARAGVCLLKHYLARYHDDKSMVLAAYYQGQTAADQHGVYRMTRPYIASILALERYFAR
jgi:LysM repeat protein